MKIQELKQRTLEVWQFLNEWKGQVLQPENFVQEVRKIGDRRYKATWIRALAHFRAMFAYESCLDAWSLIRNHFNFTEDRWDYEIRHEIIDAFLQYPDSLELIKMGLEQLFSQDFTTQERQEADGFFRLVAEQQGRGICLPAGLAAGASGAYATAQAG